MIEFIRRLWRAALRVALLALILLLLLVARGCVFRPSSGYTGGHFNQGKNAAWLGVEWSHEPHTDDAIKTLAADLAQQQIRYVFVYASYLRNDGSFNPTFAQAANFIRVFKAEQPTIKVLAWIGLPLRPTFGNVDLSDNATRRKITDLCAEFVQKIGFDGIHLDPEIVRDGDTNTLRLLDETRQAIQPALLSMATRAIQPIFSDFATPFSDLFGWRSAYYREVAKRVDQIVVMSYDSTLTAGSLYRQWMRFQVINISKAVSGIGVELLFGVPTSEEATATHNPTVETMINGLQGVIDGLNDQEAVPIAVSGVAIYPYWETDPREWASYAATWLK